MRSDARSNAAPDGEASLEALPSRGATSSGASVSVAASSGSARSSDGERAALEVGHDEGLEPGGLLGRGGMGEVRIARDRRLGRDVALKTPRQDEPGAASRLVQEAGLTARLEHPNIMPVYTAGVDREGQPYYTMRLLPGSSLTDALRLADGLPGRLRLVRHVIDAAQAMAYAHGRGVLHRDLKPSNIMVGPFGETVVADWGIACALSPAARGPGAGTPGYMSPEQAAGGVLDQRTDVYGLGAVLWELLVGKGPPESARPPAVRAALPAVPAELAAIADRALQADPARRYASAQAFADDLLAWFEGRRVTAHPYTLREVIGRSFAMWRIPILVGGAGVIALIAALAVGFWRTETERVRAVASEGAAVLARRAEEEALAFALLAQARTAAGDERRLEAEVLASNALSRREFTEGRGILARLGGRPRLALVRGGPTLPSCIRRAISGDGERLACVTAEDVRLLNPYEANPPLAVTNGHFQHVAFVPRAAGGEPDLVLTDELDRVWRWSPPAAPVPMPVRPLSTIRFGDSARPGWIPVMSRGVSAVLDLERGELRMSQACGDGYSSYSLAIDAEGALLLGCTDSRVRRAALDGTVEVLFELTAAEGPACLLTVLPNGEVVIGTVRGQVIVVGRDGQERARLSVGEDAISQLVARPDAPGSAHVRLAMATVGGMVTLWTPGVEEWGTPLYAPGALLAWTAADELRLVATSAEDRRAPSPLRPHRVPVSGGVAGVSVSPDGREVAVATGDGAFYRVDLDSGRTLATWRWQEGVAKDVAWSPDGRWIATATASREEQYRVEVATAARVPIAYRKARRTVWLPHGWILTAAYGPSLLGAPPTRAGVAPGVGANAPIELLDRQFFELEGIEGGGAVGVDTSGQVWRLSDTDPPLAEAIALYPDITAVAGLGTDTLIVRAASMARVGAHGELRATWPLRGVPVDIATSSAGLVAIAFKDGTVTVRDVDRPEPAALLVGHTARVASLAFSPDGRWLVTGGWDSEIRVWWLGDFEVDPDVLRDRIEREWGRTLPEVLLTNR